MNRATGTIGVVVGVCVAASIGVVRATSISVVGTTTFEPRAPVEVLVPLSEVPQAAQYVGMGGCATSTCHVGPKQWAEKIDGGKDGRKHINAINQLAAKQYPNVTKYVAAVGGKGAYGTKLCTDCHTTPKPGDDIEGVTCERCHGGGSTYLEAHSKDKPAKPASAYSDKGMKDYSKGTKWAPLCNGCHILGNSAAHQKLADAGHPTGAEFDLGQKYAIVMGPPGASTHWNKSRYTTAQVAAFLPARPAAPRPAAAAAPAAPPPAPVVTPPATPPAVVAPPPVTAPAPTPTPVLAPTPPVSNPPAPVTPAPTPVTPASPAATPPRTTPVTTPPIVPAPRPVETVVPPVPPAAVTAPPPVTRPPRPAAAPVTPSVQEPEPVASAPAAAAEPRTVSSILAAAQGRIISVLTAFLGQNVSVPQRVVPPGATPRFTGPDAELLRLQHDVIALALELLSAPPPKGGGK